MYIPGDALTARLPPPWQLHTCIRASRAETIGVNKSSVYRWLSGEADPRDAALEAIEALWDGLKNNRAKRKTKWTKGGQDSKTRDCHIEKEQKARNNSIYIDKVSHDEQDAIKTAPFEGKPGHLPQMSTPGLNLK